MFYLYHHNDLGSLADLLGALRNNHRVAPLDMDTILVPNHGVGRWLTIQIAESDGIAANINTSLPGGYIWQLLDAVSPAEQPRGKHFEPDGLPWHLYLALPAMAHDIPAVGDYLGAPVDEVRRWQLAGQLAGVFDRYLIYRADMLADWENGVTPADNPGRWQAQVWRYLTAANRLGSNHRARVLIDFVSRLSNDVTVQKRVVDYCPAPLYCFGLVAVAPDHLRLLYALAEHIDVHFLLPNPSEVYWGDITTGRLPLTLPESENSTVSLPGEIEVDNGHPLLSALGRMARDTLRVLYSDEFSGLIDPEIGHVLPYHKPKDDSLLHRIQTDIATLDCNDSSQGMDEADTSLEIHACHSALREVQVLQDQLLDRLAADDKQVAACETSAADRLAPRDIIVMLPDVATYTPAIKAVFGGAPRDRYLPFGLADRARSATHPIVSCIATLIDLPLSRWQASDLLDLLAVPAVMRRFGLSTAEIDTITKWINDAGIRWGRDAKHRKQLGAGAFGQNTWRFGFDRLLLGVAQSDDETLIDGVAPWSNLEGGSTAALGKLWRFERTLAQTAEMLAKPMTPGQWQACLNELVDAIITPAPDEPDEQRAVDSLRQVFAQLETAETCTQAIPLNADRTVSWQAVRDMLHTTLDSASERQPFLAGGITFCGMVPLRAVPFRVVCVLGLNDDAFPRQDNGRAFNVMYQKPRLGDRNIRDDDRLLFLQALTSARDVFYISYIGQDVHTGETLPPSPIVGETLEFIHRYYFRNWPAKDFRDRLIHNQPMQPFSLRYFSPDETDPRVFTYAGNWRDATQAAIGARTQQTVFLDDSTAPLDEPIEAIDLVTLKRFFSHPPKAFFHERLNLKLNIEATSTEDDEPITLNPLAEAKLRQRLFDSADVAGLIELPTEASPLERARGMLPPPPLANASYATEAESVNLLLPTWQDWTNETAPNSVDINLDNINGVRLTGRVSSVWPDVLRRLRVGRLRTKFRLHYWIDYLAVVASGHDVALEIVGFEDKKASRKIAHYRGQIDYETACTELSRLVQLYLDGQQRPLLYHPELDDEYVAHQNKAFANFSYRFNHANRNPHHLIRDAYFALLLGPSNAPLGDETNNPFIETIKAVSTAMNEAIQPIDAQAGKTP